MLSSRLIIVAQSLSIVALAFDIANFLDLGPKITLGITSLATATAAFLVARRHGSLIVSCALVVKGAFDTILAAQTDITQDSLRALIFGVTFGGWILALGIAKSITTARAIKLRTADDKGSSLPSRSRSIQ
jgi:hypothetical protein